MGVEYLFGIETYGWKVCCDYFDCYAIIGHESSQESAVKRAQKAGWIQIAHGFWRCPEHKEK